METISDLMEVDIFRLSGCNSTFICLFVFRNVVIFEDCASGNVMIWDRTIDFIDVEIVLRNF